MNKYFLFTWLSVFNIDLFSVFQKQSQLVEDIDFTNNACPFCHKIFNRKADVQRHYVELHMKHAEWTCANCEKRFKRKYVMEQHFRNCKARCCHSCMTMYPNEATLIEHIEKEHTLCSFWSSLEDLLPWRWNH